MSCTKTRERLEAHVDGMLAPAERAEVERHLAGCASCTAEAEKLRSLHELLAASPAVEPSAGFEASFLTRLRLEPATADANASSNALPVDRGSLWQRLFGGWRGVAFAGAAAAAAVAIAVAVWPAREVAEPDGTGGRPPPAAIAVEPELLRRMELLRNLDVAKHLDALEGVTEEELEAVAEMPGLGG